MSGNRVLDHSAVPYPVSSEHTTEAIRKVKNTDTGELLRDIRFAPNNFKKLLKLGHDGFFQCVKKEELKSPAFPVRPFRNALKSWTKEVPDDEIQDFIREIETFPKKVLPEEKLETIKKELLEK